MSCPARCGQRTLLTPAGHAAVDKRRIAAEHLARAHSQPFGDAGSKALDQSVRMVGQSQHHLRGTLATQIKPDRATTATERTGR